MNDKLKSFAKDSVYYALGDWLNKLSGLILVPILSRMFLPGDYGIIDLLNYSYMFLQMFTGLNIDSGMQKYYYLKEGEQRKILISSTMLIRLVITCIVAALIILFSKSLSLFAFNKIDYYSLILLLALCIPMDDINAQLMLYLRLERKPISFSVYNTIQVVMQLIATYIFVIGFGYGIDGVFVARLLTITAITVILMISQRSLFTRTIKLGDAFELMRFSLPGLPALIQVNIMNLLPRYFLAYFSTLTAVGLFGIADKIAKTVDMFKSSFNRAWNPFAFSNAGKSDEKYIYEKVFKLFAFCLLFLVVVLTAFAKDVLSILTPPMYHSAATFVGGLSIYYALRGLTLIFSTCLYSANKVAHTSVIATIQLLVFIVCALILVPIYNTGGMILSLDVSIMVYVACYAYAVKKYYSFPFSGQRLLLALMLAIAYIGSVSYTNYVLSYIGEMSHVILKLVLIIIFVYASYYVILTKRERDGFVEAIKSQLASRKMQTHKS
jgi:O-antigen/teichoic acid export membrane protein